MYVYIGQKQFSKQSVFDSHLNGKKHLKAAENLSKKGKVTAKDVQSLMENHKEERRLKEKNIASLEAFVMKYGNELARVVEDTKSHVERKQSRTVEEREVITLK